MANIDDAKIAIALIIASLADAGGKKPSGHLFAEQADLSLREYELLISFGEVSGLWRKRRNHLIVLTEKGAEVAQEIRSALTEDV